MFLKKGLLVVCSIQGALIVALWWILATRPPVQVDQALLDDPRVRDQVVKALAAKVGGAYDSHNDPQVARVLLKSQRKRNHGTIDIDTNRFGLREWDYAMPKPEGMVRVVLLGDSYIFGTGCPEEERLGRHLERYLRERSGNPRVEVLHYGIMSWNVVAECSYLRRQLSLVQPDLVIHVTLDNDLDDMEGVRGFGGLSRFSPPHRERATGSIRAQHPKLIMNSPVAANALLNNHDSESSERFAEARDALNHLVHELDRRGARYLHVFRWPGTKQSIRKILGRDLTDDQVAYVADTFTFDKSKWASPDDMHWGPTGMRDMAQLCYGLITQRGLLPQLSLPTWDAAEDAVNRIHVAGMEESSLPVVRRPTFDNIYDFAGKASECVHVYGGVDAEGLTSPYAALSLQNPHGTTLRLKARALERPEMDGAHVRVLVDGLPVGTFETTADAEIDLTWPLPEELRSRPYVTVAIASDDWVYLGDDLQECAVLKLRSVEIEP